MRKQILQLDRCSEVKLFSARHDIPSNGTFLITEARKYNSCWRQEIWLQNIMRMGSLCCYSHSHYTLCHENRFILWHFQLLLPSLSQTWGIRILMPNKFWPQNLTPLLFYASGQGKYSGLLANPTGHRAVNRRLEYYTIRSAYSIFFNPRTYHFAS